MIDIDAKYMDTVKRILNTRVAECEVWVFGSRVTGGARKYSDLDIALIGAEKIDIQRLEALRDDFAESALPFMVDVLDWHDISDSFRQVISKKGNWVRLTLK